MGIVKLCFTDIFALLSHMDHAPVHRDRLAEDRICELWDACLPQCMNATFGECQIDRLCVQRCALRKSNILISAVSGYVQDKIATFYLVLARRSGLHDPGPPRKWLPVSPRAQRRQRLSLWACWCSTMTAGGDCELIVCRVGGYCTVGGMEGEQASPKRQTGPEETPEAS
jgi:hypothetical protein